MQPPRRRRRPAPQAGRRERRPHPRAQVRLRAHDLRRPRSSPPDDADAGPSMFDPRRRRRQRRRRRSGSTACRAASRKTSKRSSPRRASLRELEDRWKEQYAALKQRADELRAKAKQIEHDFREVKKNPLRALAQLDALQTAARRRRRPSSTPRSPRLQALPAQAQADRQAIDAARKQDEQFLRDAPDDRQDRRRPAHRVPARRNRPTATSPRRVGWVNYVRSWIPKSKIERPGRARGTNVLFVDRRRPKCLIERVALAGTARLDGQPLEVTGVLTDAASEPELHDAAAAAAPRRRRRRRRRPARDARPPRRRAARHARARLPAPRASASARSARPTGWP